MASLRAPLKRARGLGTAKDGTHHWWMQRVTALALVPLSLWLVISVIAHLGADHDAMVDWVGTPVVAILLIATLVATFYHAALGVQVVIEDYVHHEGIKLIGVTLAKLMCLLLGIAGVFSVGVLALGG